MPRHDISSLFRGAGLELFDFHCAERRCDLGREEVATADELVFVRGGAFEVEARGGRTWVDPTRVLLLRRGEPYRVAHPAGAGDACTVISLGRELSEAALGERKEALAARRRSPHRSRELRTRCNRGSRAPPSASGVPTRSPSKRRFSTSSAT